MENSWPHKQPQQRIGMLSLALLFHPNWYASEEEVSGFRLQDGPWLVSDILRGGMLVSSCNLPIP